MAISRQGSDRREARRMADPDLFVRPDGKPMVFLMSPTAPERQEVGRGLAGGRSSRVGGRGNGQAW